MSDLVRVLTGDDADAARDAAREALAGGDGATLLDGLVGLAGEERFWEWERALGRLGELPESEALIPPLLDALRDPANAERRNVSRSLLAALARRGSAASARAVARMSETTRVEADVDVRVLAATALGESENPAARPALEAALADAEPNVGAAAADALGVLGDVEAVGALSRLPRSTDLWVRLAAVVSLGRLGDRRATPVLTAALDEPLLVDAAVAALGEIRDPAALDGLRRVVSAPGATRDAALRACERILGANPRSAVPEWLRTSLRGEEAALAAALVESGDEGAAHLLGIAGTERAAAHLIDALESPFAQAAATALNALPEQVARKTLIEWLPGTAGAPRSAVLAALPALREAGEVDAVIPLLSDPDDTTRAAAIEALGRSEPAVLAARIAPALQEPGSRHAAVRVLGYLEGDACATLVTLLDDADAQVRCAAAEALTRCATTAVRSRIVEALGREREPRVRDALIEALGAAGGAEAVAVIEPFLEDADPAARFAAIRALGRTRSGQALQPLLRLLGTATRELDGAVLLALGELGDARAAGPVAVRLAAADRDIRLTAAHALRELRNPEVVAALVAALDDPSWGVRHAAVRTLGAVGAHDALERLRGLRLRDPDALVRDAAGQVVDSLEGSGTGDAA